VLVTETPLIPIVKVRDTVAGVVGVGVDVTDNVGVFEGVAPATHVPLYCRRVIQEAELLHKAP